MTEKGKGIMQAEYQIQLRPTPDKTDPRGVRRLRALLKAALRRYGLKCVGCTPAVEDATDRGQDSANST